MSYAAGRTERLKFGTRCWCCRGATRSCSPRSWRRSTVLSDGRLLPAFGLGVADRREQQAFGVARDERAAWFDEALP